MSGPTKAELQAELYQAKNAPLTKQWWKSKMVWINIGEFVAGLALLIAELPQEMNAAAVAMLIHSVVNLALRIWGTKTKLTR